jgi:hypothetical protein
MKGKRASAEIFLVIIVVVSKEFAKEEPKLG